MFEFHGWINIVPDHADDAEISILNERMDALTEELEQKIRELEWSAGVFSLHKGLNGDNHLVMTGLANHRQEQVIELLRWVARGQPHSYGLLHVRDDEDFKRGYENTFRVFALARGTVTENTESSLSPCIPKIEQPLE